MHSRDKKFVPKILSRSFLGSIKESINLFLAIFSTVDLVDQSDHFFFHGAVALAVRNTENLSIVLISIRFFFVEKIVLHFIRYSLAVEFWQFWQAIQVKGTLKPIIIAALSFI